MKVYVTRSKNDIEDDRVFIWDRKPTKNNYPVFVVKNKDKSDVSFVSNYEPLFSYHYRTFEKHFKFVSEKGTCTEMELSLRRNKK